MGTEETAQIAPDSDAARAALRDVVVAHIEAVGADADAAASRLVRKKPYFYKEYGTYPADAANIMVIELQETDSKTAPFRAEVTLPKTRFATRLHRERGTASADEDFIRQTGRETLSYAMRSGRWHALGSAFVADRTETATSGGVWQETDKAPASAVAEGEPGKGWFSRQWSKIFGE